MVEKCANDEIMIEECANEYRAPHFCKAALQYTSMGVIIEKEVQDTCGQNGKIKTVEVGGITDVQEEMKQLFLEC